MYDIKDILDYRPALNFVHQKDNVKTITNKKEKGAKFKQKFQKYHSRCIILVALLPWLSSLLFRSLVRI